MTDFNISELTSEQAKVTLTKLFIYSDSTQQYEEEVIYELTLVKTPGYTFEWLVSDVLVTN